MSLKMKIRMLLDSKGCKDKDLALYLGMTRTKLSYRMNGSIEFRHSEINKVLEFLQCKYEDIFI